MNPNHYYLALLVLAFLCVIGAMIKPSVQIMGVSLLVIIVALFLKHCLKT